MTLGPVNPTVVERLASVFRLPYGWAAFVFAALIGPPAQFVVSYLDTLDLNRAFGLTFNLAYTSTSVQVGRISTSQGLTNQTIWFATIFSFIYLTRFMRARLSNLEQELLGLAPSGEETFHKAFGGISRSVPVLLISIPFFISQMVPIFQLFGAGYGYFFSGFQVVATVFFAVIFSNFFWVYFRSLWGLDRFGKEHLKLKTYDQDAMLGLGSLG